MQLTEIFDFLWPSAAALWNLRWQVKGFLDSVPNASEAELTGRFVQGSGLRGVNLRKATIMRSWNEQQQQLALFVLISAFAVYESWVDSLLEVLNDTNQLTKDLQFPTTKDKGIWNAIAKLTKPESVELRESIYPSLIVNPKYSGPNLDNLMTCYRYFKELRNCLIHHGGIVDNRCEEAYLQFKKVATTSDLGIKEVPEHIPTIDGDHVNLSLRGVIGFSDVMLRIMTTIDAEVSQAKVAESEFVRRWINVYGKVVRISKSDNRVRSHQIERRVQLLSLPKPKQTQPLELLLKRAGLLN